MPWSGMSGVMRPPIHVESVMTKRSVRAPVGSQRTVAVEASGRYMPCAYSRSTDVHQRLPPSSASAATAAAPLNATRPANRRRRSGCSPGGRPPSRAAVPIIVAKPATSRPPSTTSIQPIARCMPRRAVATASTGMVAEPRPCAPSTPTLTTYEPDVMSHSCAA